MSAGQFSLVIGSGVGVLLILILVFRIQAFIALLVGAIVSGLVAGQSAMEVIETVKTGMAGTLGFVATVVGLGSIFGSILEKSGGAAAISNFLLNKFGLNRAPLALLLTGFVIAIPVFFDVAFIILIPLVYSIQRQTGKSLLLYAIPLLAGLAVTHTFIPPTPGPIAVADMLEADLGMVIICGLLVGLPTALISGLFFGRFIGGRLHVGAPISEQLPENNLPSIQSVLPILLLPIALILLKTSLDAGFYTVNSAFAEAIALCGHPFGALIIANFLAWYFLGIKRGYSREELFKMSTKSLETAGVIILITGAGGVFKQTLVDTGAGPAIALGMAEAGFPIIIFAFLAAALVRVLQGSATVAMITASGLVAPLIVGVEYSEFQLAILVITIASGASIFSHVNDSGFWLVSQYLKINERQTFKSWTMMTTVFALSGFVFSSLLWVIA